MIENFNNILERIDNYFNKISQLSHNEYLSENSWKYYPTNLELFNEMLNIIKKNKNIINKKFLDVGSGIGHLCYLAKLNGFDAEGLELNPKLLEISNELYPEINFINMNILDFNNYGDYDVIYYFAPFNNIKLQQELKEKIENTIKIGSYIITIDIETKDDRFKKIKYNNQYCNCWLKIKE